MRPKGAGDVMGPGYPWPACDPRKVGVSALADRAPCGVERTTRLWTLPHNDRVEDRSWDQRIMSAVAEHRSGDVNHVAIAVSDAGRSPWVLAILAILALLVVLWRRWYRPGLAAAAAFVAASIAVDVLKPLFDRPRPPHHLALVGVDGPAFPSTHAATTSALAAAVLVSVVWGTWSRTVVATSVLATVVVLVGGCMVYLGAHWTTDVLGGWILGTAIGAAIGWAVRRPQPTGGGGNARVEHAR
jgi:membrane-associated phospholipid phosphatase